MVEGVLFSDVLKAHCLHIQTEPQNTSFSLCILILINEFAHLYSSLDPELTLHFVAYPINVLHHDVSWQLCISTC